MDIKKLLTELAIAVTLVTLGAIGGYVFSQTAIINRCERTLERGGNAFNSQDLKYIAVGDTLTK